MPSIHNIPEPTTAYRPVVDEPTAPPPSPASGRRPDCAETKDATRPDTEIDDELGARVWLAVLVLSGVVLRVALLYFGSLHTATDTAVGWIEQGGRLLEAGPSALDGTLPVYPLMAWSLDTVGLPMLLLPLLQAVVGVVAIVAMFHVARSLTGRNMAGLGSAALVALHPGVLVWGTAIHPAGLAGSLIILALFFLVGKHDADKPVDTSNAWPAGVLLAFAGLLAPAAWLVGLGAAWVCLLRGSARQGVTQALIILTLSIAPALGWAQLSAGQYSAAWQRESTSVYSTAHFAALADHSLPEMGALLRFEMHPHGTLARLIEGRPDAPAHHDAVIDMVGDLWIGINAVLLLGGALSVGLMFARGRGVAAACGAVPLLLLIFGGFTLNEPTRIAMLGCSALLAVGWLSTRRTPLLTETQKQALADERAYAEQVRRDEKLVKQQQKGGLYAFDKGQPPVAKTEPQPAATSEAVQGEGDTPPPMMRPI